MCKLFVRLVMAVIVVVVAVNSAHAGSTRKYTSPKSFTLHVAPMSDAAFMVLRDAVPELLEQLMWQLNGSFVAECTALDARGVPCQESLESIMLKSLANAEERFPLYFPTRIRSTVDTHFFVRRNDDGRVTQIKVVAMTKAVLLPKCGELRVWVEKDDGVDHFLADIPTCKLVLLDGELVFEASSKTKFTITDGELLDALEGTITKNSKVHYYDARNCTETRCNGTPLTTGRIR